MPDVCESTILKGPWILDETDEKFLATADRIENDRLFAEHLQDSQYSQHIMTRTTKIITCNYNPAVQEKETYEDNDGDNYNPE